MKKRRQEKEDGRFWSGSGLDKRARRVLRQLISFFSGRKRDIPAITLRHPHSADAVNGARGGSIVLPGFSGVTSTLLQAPLYDIIARMTTIAIV